MTEHSLPTGLKTSYGINGEPRHGFDLPTPPPWMAAAVCAQTDPEAFYPEKGSSTREAKSVCARCTVAAECLDWAVANEERFGVWGGLSERERRKIKPNRQVPA